LWNPQGRQLPIVRILMLLVGGLSSPLVIILTALYAVRAALVRTRFAWLDLGVAAFAAGVQYSVMPMTSGSTLATIALIPKAMFVRKFFGYFIYVPAQYATHEGATLFAGVTLLLALIFCAWRYRRDLNAAFYILFAACLLAALASSIRQPLIQLHPALAGPRYFFLPFAFLFWAVLQLFAVKAALPRIIAVATLALVARNALDVGQRDSDKFDWRANVDACAAADQHEFPIGYDGRAVAAWKVTLRGDDCRRLVANSWFDNRPYAGGAAQ